MSICKHRAQLSLANVVAKYYYYKEEAEAVDQDKNGLQLHTMEDAAHTYLMLSENLHYILTGEVTDKMEEIKEYRGA